MIVYAGMSRSIKYVNKVGMGNSRNKINKLIPYNPTLVHSYFVFCSLLTCTYVGLYGNDLFNFVPAAIPTLFTYFLGFDISTYAFIFIENVFLLFLSITITNMN